MTFLGESYGDDLARVGLPPDNPDGMYAALTSFLHAPKAFKDADKCWPGARDNLSWYESPKGVARLIWPFHGGKWLTEGPKNEAQIRAVFKIPADTGTKQGLSKLYGFPFRSDLSYSLALESHSCGGGIDLDPHINVDLDPGHALKALGIPTPDDLLHQAGLPSVGDILKSAGLPSDPLALVSDDRRLWISTVMVFLSSMIVVGPDATAVVITPATASVVTYSAEIPSGDEYVL